MADRITIASKTINTQNFYEITNNILDSFVNNSTSPFNTVLDTFKGYLDGVPDNEMDVVQKTTSYADFLKDIYSQINEKAMNIALDILKFNEEVELQRIKVEADTFLTDNNSSKIVAETALINKSIDEKNKQIEVLTANIEAGKLQNLVTRAQLVKQWGVKDDISFSFGANTYSPVTDATNGGTFYYRTNSLGGFIKKESTIDAGAGEIYGTTTTNNPLIYGEMYSQTGTISTTIENAVKPGVVDQQIRGYDVVNLKDILKTADERAALLANAKIAETQGELDFRENLVNAIKEASILTIPVTISNLNRDKV